MQCFKSTHTLNSSPAIHAHSIWTQSFMRASVALALATKSSHLTCFSVPALCIQAPHLLVWLCAHPICYFHCALHAFYFIYFFFILCFISSFVPAEFVFEKWRVLCAALPCRYPKSSDKTQWTHEIAAKPSKRAHNHRAVLSLRNRWHSGVSVWGCYIPLAMRRLCQFSSLQLDFGLMIPFSVLFSSIFPFGYGLRNVYDDFWPNACG